MIRVQGGFSLVEVLIVLSVLTILTGTVAGNLFSGMALFEVTGAAEVLASDIRWLQQVTINSVNSADEIVVIPELIMQQTAPFGYIIVGQNAVIRAYQFPATVKLSNDARHLAFKTSGRPADGAQLTFALCSTRDSRITKKVIVEMITGRVRIE